MSIGFEMVEHVSKKRVSHGVKEDVQYFNYSRGVAVECEVHVHLMM